MSKVCSSLIFVVLMDFAVSNHINSMTVSLVAKDIERTVLKDIQSECSFITLGPTFKLVPYHFTSTNLGKN